MFDLALSYFHSLQLYKCRNVGGMKMMSIPRLMELISGDECVFCVIARQIPKNVVLLGAISTVSVIGLRKFNTQCDI